MIAFLLGFVCVLIAANVLEVRAMDARARKQEEVWMKHNRIVESERARHSKAFGRCA